LEVGDPLELVRSVNFEQNDGNGYPASGQHLLDLGDIAATAIYVVRQFFRVVSRHVAEFAAVEKRDGDRVLVMGVEGFSRDQDSVVSIEMASEQETRFEVNAGDHEIKLVFRPAQLLTLSLQASLLVFRRFLGRFLGLAVLEDLRASAGRTFSIASMSSCCSAPVTRPSARILVSVEFRNTIPGRFSC
jgi:hypothetical protein